MLVWKRGFALSPRLLNKPDSCHDFRVKRNLLAITLALAGQNSLLGEARR